MKTWSLCLMDILSATKGKVVSSPAPKDLNAVEVSSVQTDSRANVKDSLFIALEGEKFDGHQFVASVVAQGAKVVLVHRWLSDYESLQGRCVFVQVSNTLTALQDLALSWRKRWGFRVLGITGSNGKTSTKEFSYAILSQQFRCHASPGSFNNHWGVPLSILQANPDTQILILEMGMNHSGEITRLCQVAEPDVVVVTMVGQSHIGELGSQEAVAKAKEEIYLASPRAVQIYNLDNEWTIKMHEHAQTRLPKPPKVITYSSFRDGADVKVRIVKMMLAESLVEGLIQGTPFKAQIPVIGRHNTVNLMAACSLAMACGMTAGQIEKALPHCKSSAWGRNQWVNLKNGTKIFFDAYNANPESMIAMLKNIYEFEFEGRRYFVLGEMLELGKMSAELHERLGRQVADIGPDGVWFIGPSGKDFERGISAAGYDKKLMISSTYEDSLAMQMASMLEPNDLVAIKGSRGMKLERVVQAWNPVDFKAMK